MANNESKLNMFIESMRANVLPENVTEVFAFEHMANRRGDKRTVNARKERQEIMDSGKPCVRKDYYAMLSRLAKMGFIEYQPAKGAQYARYRFLIPELLSNGNHAIVSDGVKPFYFAEHEVKTIEPIIRRLGPERATVVLSGLVKLIFAQSEKK